MLIDDGLDTIVAFSCEAIKDAGEDSFCCAYRGNTAIAAVFDGCGGLGSRIYPRFKEHTGAYISSRLVCGAVYDWFVDDSYYKSADIINGIRSYIQEAFKAAMPYTEGSAQFWGSMVRDMPTTAAIAFVQMFPTGFLLNAIWAGDSRVYILDQHGLAQVTKDDIEMEDAFTNLQNDGVLTNLISSDGKYDIHIKKLALQLPCIVFSATDGCFGYFQTPMDFEYLLLDCFHKADNICVFEDILKQRIGEVAGDDFSFSLLSFGFGEYETLRAMMRKRKNMVYDKYISSLKNCPPEKIWKIYKTEYERYYGDTNGTDYE